MTSIYTKYHSTNDKDNIFIKESLYYSLGGYNFFTYQEEPRGYYLSISPVERVSRGNVVCETYTAFTGTKICVHEVQRKSKKAENIALEKAAQMRDCLLERVCKYNGVNIVQEK